MEGYTKLSSSILTSSIWVESHTTLRVWITMLALKGKGGEVPGTIPGIASIARVTIEEARDAIEKLESPDPYSRTPDHDGRRIEKIEGGWVVVNHEKYKHMLSADDKRERDRARQERIYAREKARKGENSTISHIPDPISQIPVKDISPDGSSVQLSLSGEIKTEPDLKLREAVKEVWEYYISKTGKNPTLYTFTDNRRKKGMIRMRESLKTWGSLEKAVSFMKLSVDGMLRSDWHVGKTDGQKKLDWCKNLFPNFERMEEWWNNA